MRQARLASIGLVVALAVVVAVRASAATPSPARSATGAIAYITGSGRGEPVVWVASAGGTHRVELGQGSEPSLAPDGRLVAASSEATRGSSLVIYSAAGGGEATGYFDLSKVGALPLAWSPDSRYLAVALTGVQVPTEKGSGLAIVDTRTGTARMIAPGQIAGASFSPGASDELVYGRSASRSYGGPVNLYTTDPTGSTITQITHDGVSLNPLWGARGIAFDHERLRPGYAPLYQIWLMASDGRSHQITHVTANKLVDGLVPLALSADGTRLAAEFEGQDTFNGWVVSLLTGSATQLLPASRMNVSAWGISRDGRDLLIAVGGFESPPDTATVEELPFAGGPPTPLIPHADLPSWNL
jgi:Tol biopolymer transport system component